MTQRIYAWRISAGEKASAVFDEEGILHILPLLRFQHFLSLVPIDFAEAGVDGVCRVAAVFGEERILHILPLLRIQHFWSLVPIDFAEAGIDGL